MATDIVIRTGLDRLRYALLFDRSLFDTGGTAWRYPR
mgnify:CR=1 FL=1